MMKTSILSVIFILFISAFSYGQYTYTQPVELQDGWKTNDVRSLELDTTGIYQLFNQLQQGEHKLHSVLVVKNEEILLEEYFNGHSFDQQHDMRSATKSITSLLVGIAIDKGFIQSIDDPISKYLKTYVPKKNQDERKEQITIKHLLTMSSGLDCNDWDKQSKGQEDKVYKKRDWLQYTLDLPMVNNPGEVSNYCSMGTVLAAEIISQVSGMPIDEFAEEYLFKPLNISNLSWGHTSKKKVLSSGKRLYMTPRDMAKVGQLILNKGTWNEQQIVSGKWLEESTTATTKISGVDYGYLWWNIPFKQNEKMINSIVATGNGGQYILILPELDMVVVFTGGAYNSQEDKLAFAIMKDILLPTFANKE